MPPTNRPSSSSTPLNSLVGLGKALLFERKYYWVLVSLLTIFEAALGLVIIWKVPYTKIDWPAYMQQVSGFRDGERDYTKLEGDTGPLVYPALHLYIYTLLQKFLPASEALQVRYAQYFFLGIYLITFNLVSGIYYLASRSSHKRLPQALLIPLVLSKRLHSIYLLRLFNDPLAMVFLYAGVVCWMLGGLWGAAGTILYALALGVKMNILLFLPGAWVMLFQIRGLGGMLESTAVIALIQLALPYPFILKTPEISKGYFTSSFNFSRQFLYEWTVNWRFIPENVFLSREFSNNLLFFHATLLVIFALFKWLPSPAEGSLFKTLGRGLKNPLKSPYNIKSLPSHYIPLLLFASNLIGITFARSLHYQFHSWYFHQIPFLLVMGGAWNNVILGAVLWSMIEYGWATFPSTTLSSGVLFTAHIIMLGGLLFVNKPHEIQVPSLSGVKLKQKYK